MVKKNKSRDPKKIFLIAGEPSGDNLGANLMDGLVSKYREIEFFGVGGPAMIGKGLISIFPYEELSIMGFVEVLSNLAHLLRRKNQLIENILAGSFDAVITIDSPDFNLRVAKGIKKGGYKNPVIHYVAPTVWAWRQGRVKKIRQCVDHILTLFPFENEVLEKSGISCSFVGHPIAALKPPVASEITKVTKALDLNSGQPTLLILPGSRKSEVFRLGPVFVKVATMFKAAFPNYQIVVVPSPGFIDQLRDIKLFGWPEDTKFFDFEVFDSNEQERMKLSLFTLSELAMAASGTVSLELAATSTPMVIGYDMNWISRQIIGTLLLVDTVTLVNLITATKAVPEFLGKKFTAENMFFELKQLASDVSKQNTQKNTFTKALIGLGKNNQNLGDLPSEAVKKLLSLN